MFFLVITKRNLKPTQEITYLKLLLKERRKQQPVGTKQINGPIISV